ncbi:GxGYxYP family putative glycoside hydrolase [Clostridium sp. CTA-19]
MNKKLKNHISFLLIFLCMFYGILIKPQNIKAYDTPINTVNLVLDVSNPSHYNEVPETFRKTSDISSIKNNANLNLTGLDKLNISGSHQFSGHNLPILIKNIDTKLPITVIDLRQESHGFINNFPVSWANAQNNANVGLSKDEVLKKEKNDLDSIKLGVPIKVYNNPNFTVVPATVENEEKLVTSNSLSYIRIPVTDNNLPTDDMVDYFIETVKSQPKNTWLHFHCKHGVGRTTTFMVMYDMIKNYKDVSAEDIIKRQILLGNLKDTPIKPFYDKNSLAFLQNFYKYCKENGDNFNIKYSDWKKTTTTSNSFFPIAFLSNSSSKSYYIKNSKTPTTLYVISQNAMTASERTMISTLQGIVNSKCSSQIYTLNSSQPDYEIWLNDLKNNYGIICKNISDPWELLNTFKDYTDGYVLYNTTSTKNPSINNACSFASLNNCIAIDETLQDKVKSQGITRIKGDCRNTDKNWAYDNLWDKGLNHSIVIQLSPEKDTALRDYAIMTKSLIFYEDSVSDTSLRDKIFSSMEIDSICLGWGPDEFTNVSTTSKYGVGMVAADWSYNLTVLSAFDSLPVNQKSSQNIPNKKNAHYVTFIISDGDNQQWNLGSNYGSLKWFGSPYRGEFNLGWSLSPSLFFLSPTVFDLYYKTASNGTNNDYFIVSPSGNGYIYPSKFNTNALTSYTTRLNEYMKKTDEKYVAIIDDSSFYNNELWDKFTIKSNIDGLFYLDYHRHDNYHGKINWSNNKPIVSCRDLLWSNLEDEDTLIKNINDRVKSGQTDIHDANSYTFVYVHAWSKDLSNVKYAVDKLKENPNVEIVTPKIFMELISKNVTH